MFHNVIFYITIFFTIIFIKILNISDADQVKIVFDMLRIPILASVITIIYIFITYNLIIKKETKNIKDMYHYFLNNVSIIGQLKNIVILLITMFLTITFI